MSILPELIGAIIAAYILNIITALRYRNKEKIDKGFVMNYHKLTYRRKFKRDLWGLPFLFIFFSFLYEFLSTIDFIIIFTLFFILVFPEMIYHYVKWKRTEEVRD
ncbi:hypothetical protein [Oceanobacillus kapialis]|uniref:SdpI family protein n=1 Tax=Oceanobacillus kapialis TaxID=481353 RepID=A0ABW5Q3A7_9BACI